MSSVYKDFEKLKVSSELNKTGDNGMEKTMMRISTFPNYNETLVSAIRLADAGFYIDNGHILCFECKVQIDDWSIEDDPLLKHKSRNPTCRFIIQKLAGEAVGGSNEASGGFDAPPHTGDYGRNPKGKNGSAVDRLNEQRELQHPLSPGSKFHWTPPAPNQTKPPAPRQPLPRETPRQPLPGDEQPMEPLLPPGPPKEKQKAKAAPHLRRESARLRTFSVVDWSSLSTSNITRETIARAGMYYCGPNDKVQCAFCNGKLYNWSLTDIPYTEHAKHFSLCPFILNPYEAGNVRIQDEIVAVSQSGHVDDPSATMTPSLEISPSLSPEKYMLEYIKERPKHPEYSITLKRLQSYREGHYPCSGVQNEKKLSEAGFIYLGPDDNVKCFFCAGALRSWSVSDDPWEEHARWFPSCFYVRACKGENFVQMVHDKFEENGSQITSKLQQATGQTGPGSHVYDGQSLLPTHPTQSLPLPEWLESPLARQFLEMGYSKNMLKKVYDSRIREVGDDFPNPESLLDALMEQERDQSTSGISTTRGSTDARGATAQPPQVTMRDTGASANPPAQTEVTHEPSTTSNTKKNRKRKKNKKKQKEEKQKEADNATAKPGGSSNSSEDEKASKLEKENEALKEQRICKICLDADVNIVFLRCGHLVCCSNCAPNLRNCPICRQVIRGTVRIFMS